MLKSIALFFALFIPVVVLAEVEPISTPSPNVGTITPTAITAETGSFSGSVTVGSMTTRGASSGLLVENASYGELIQAGSGSNRIGIGVNSSGAGYCGGVYVGGTLGATFCNGGLRLGSTVTNPPTDSFIVGNDTFTVTTTGIVSAPSQPGFSASTATVSIANDSSVTLVFETELFDRQDSHSAGTFTVPAWGGGIYLINCFARFTDSTTGIRSVRLVDGGVTTEYGRTNYDIGSPGTFAGTFSIVQSLSAGDSRKCQVYQNSGGPLNLTNGRMDAVKLW